MHLQKILKGQCSTDQNLPLDMDVEILRTGTRNKLTRGQQDSCHLTILPQVTICASCQKFITDKPVGMAFMDYDEESIFIKILSLILLHLNTQTLIKKKKHDVTAMHSKHSCSIYNH